MPQTDDNPFHVVIIGDASVGKSCIFLRILDDTNFKWSSRPRLPIIEEYGTIYLNFDGKRNRFKVRDGGSQEEFRRTVLIYRYFYNVNGILLAYDITKRKSFQNLTEWLEMSKAWASPTVEYVLLGNWCDLEEEREVSYEEGREFAEKHNLIFLEISAKTGENIPSAMKKLAKKMIDSRRRQEEEKAQKAAAEREKMTLQKKSQGKVGSLRKILRGLSEILSDFIFVITVFFDAVLHRSSYDHL